MKLIILTLALASLAVADKPAKTESERSEVPVIDLETQNEILATQMDLKEAEKTAMPYNINVDIKRQASVGPTTKGIAKCNPTATKEEIAAGKTALILDFRDHKVVCVARPPEQAQRPQQPTAVPEGTQVPATKEPAAK